MVKLDGASVANNGLYQELVLRLGQGLRRKGVTTCSKWAETYRVMGGKDFAGPWTFKYHPWLKDMHDSTARFNVGRKAAQMGYTETVLNRTFYKIDIERVDCLYVLPATTPDASDFSASRFDSALELSPHLSKLFSAVKNVGHKRAGSTNLYIRGSKSRSGLKSVPVGFLVLDELNEMDQDNIPLALERQSGQMEKEAWVISTPTADGHGIDEHFGLTTQEHFMFKCPHCDRFTELLYPDSVIIIGDELSDPRLKDSHYICKECKHKLDHESKIEWLQTGRWVPATNNFDDRGFYINQLYSCTITPYEIAKAYLKAQSSLADEQEFFNSKLGMPHTPEGSRINDNHLTQCIGDFLNLTERPNKVITMGVDQGRWLHCTIDAWDLPTYGCNDLNVEAKRRTIGIAKTKNFEELDVLMREHRVDYCVIDAQPERREALKFANRNYGRVKMCFYGRGVQGKQIHVHSDQGEPGITVDRTSWLDLTLGRFRSQTIQIPKDTPAEFKDHLKALVRINIKDKDDNPYGVYEKKSNDHDHYAHALNYSEIALPFAAGSGEVEDISDSPL